MLAPTLKELLLQSNRLEYLPQQLGQLKRLQLLDFAENRLRCIPVEVQRLVTESCSPPSPQRSLPGAAAQDPTGNRTVANLSSSSSPMDQPTPPQSPGPLVHNEEGGHDDDDYVQIRPGMKCWARGNRFWQVGVPYSSSSSDVPTSASAASSSASIPDSPNVQASVAYPYSAIPLPSLKSYQAPKRNNSEDPGVTGIGIYWRGGGIQDSPTTTTFSPDDEKTSHFHPSSHHREGGLSTRIHQHPGHLVDRTDYIRDSYTSCSWTLSLADICSQIAGERLHKNPHYYCHRSCPFKQNLSRDLVATIDDDKEKTATTRSFMEYSQCSLPLLPQWAIEKFGLQDLTDYHETAGDTEDSHDSVLSEHRWMEHEDRIQGTMQLTFAEREMQSDHCSVCYKRLYFEGMRWKGVGVMDERIVPLEWISCSVQCRARAEQEGRGNRGQGSSKTDFGTQDGSGVEGAEPQPQDSYFFNGFDQEGQIMMTTPPPLRQESPGQMVEGGIEDRLSLLYGLLETRGRGEETDNRTHSL